MYVCMFLRVFKCTPGARTVGHFHERPQMLFVHIKLLQSGWMGPYAHLNAHLKELLFFVYPFKSFKGF